MGIDCTRNLEKVSLCIRVRYQITNGSGSIICKIFCDGCVSCSLFLHHDGCLIIGDYCSWNVTFIEFKRQILQPLYFLIVQFLKFTQMKLI